MDEILTINEAAKLLKLSYNTVYAHKIDWGFFRMDGSRVWRVRKADLDKKIKTQNNISRLCVRVGNKTEKRKCRSEKTKVVYGKLTLPHQAASEFDAVVKRLTGN